MNFALSSCAPSLIAISISCVVGVAVSSQSRLLKLIRVILISDESRKTLFYFEPLRKLAG